MKRWRIRLAMVGALLLFSGTAESQELLTNPGLELVFPDLGGANSVPPGWSMSEGGTLPHPPTLSTAEPGNFSHLLFEGDWQMWYQPYQASFYNNGGFAHLFQDVPGTPGLKYIMSGWALFETHYAGGVDNLNLPGTGAPYDDGPVSPTDSFFALEFLDAGNAILAGSAQIELRADGQMNDTQWMQHSLNAVAPAGTVNVRVRASMTGGIWNQGADPQSFLVDLLSLTAEAAPALPGDYNQNLVVDAADYTVWRDNLGGSTALPNDGGLGTPIGQGHYDQWKANFGDTPGTGLGGVAVPEPATGVLMLFAVGLIGMRRRNR